MDLDINADLLDRQVVDSHGQPVCKVDDVQFELGEKGVWRVEAILAGPGALGPRLDGRLGATLTGWSRRWRSDEVISIPWHRVVRVESDVRLDCPQEDLATRFSLEEWLREHIISRIPGSGHASG